MREPNALSCRRKPWQVWVCAYLDRSSPHSTHITPTLTPEASCWLAICGRRASRFNWLINRRQLDLRCSFPFPPQHSALAAVPKHKVTGRGVSWLQPTLVRQAGQSQQDVHSPHLAGAAPAACAGAGGGGAAASAVGAACAAAGVGNCCSGNAMPAGNSPGPCNLIPLLLVSSPAAVVSSSSSTLKKVYDSVMSWMFL